MSHPLGGPVSPRTAAQGQLLPFLLSLGSRHPRWHRAKPWPCWWEAWLLARGRHRDKWCDECSENTGLSTWELTRSALQRPGDGDQALAPAREGGQLGMVETALPRGGESRPTHLLWRLLPSSLCTSGSAPHVMDQPALSSSKQCPAPPQTVALDPTLGLGMHAHASSPVCLQAICVGSGHVGREFWGPGYLE